MVNAVKIFGCNGTFDNNLVTGMASALGKTLSSTTTSVTATKNEFSRLSDGSPRSMKKFKREIQELASLGQKLPKSWSRIGRRSVVRMELDFEEDGRPYLKSAGFLQPTATGVAYSDTCFGEGAERIVRQFHEIDNYGWLLAPALVAKGSKFIGVNDDTSDFHLTFLLTQYRSLRLAKRFNSRLDGLEHEYANAKTIPRVTFLEASVYTMMDDRSMLVEERLETKWEKWNNNSGSVYAEDSRGSRKHGSDQKSPRGLLGIRRDHIKSGATFVPSLATIDEEEDDSGDKKHLSMYSPSDVLQCFSHWSYNYTQRQKLVCDLQGTYVRSESFIGIVKAIINHNLLRVHFRSRVLDLTLHRVGPSSKLSQAPST